MKLFSNLLIILFFCLVYQMNGQNLADLNSEYSANISPEERLRVQVKPFSFNKEVSNEFADEFSLLIEEALDRIDVFNLIMDNGIVISQNTKPNQEVSEDKFSIDELMKQPQVMMSGTAKLDADHFECQFNLIDAKSEELVFEVTISIPRNKVYKVESLGDGLPGSKQRCPNLNNTISKSIIDGLDHILMHQDDWNKFGPGDNIMTIGM